MKNIIKNKILIVDDQETNREILKAIFDVGYEVCEAADGLEAIEQIEKHGDVFAAILLDIIMPRLDGYGVLEYLYNNDILKDVPVVLITGDASTELKKKAYAMGVSDVIEKPFDSYIVSTRVTNLIQLYFHKDYLEELVQVQTVKIKKQSKKLIDMNYRIIDILGTIVEFRNLESGAHIQRVRHFTEILIKKVMDKYNDKYSITEEEAEMICNASVLHDVGKIAIPDSILLKPGRLTDEEFEIMKEHTSKGSEIIGSIKKIGNERYLRYCNEIARHHHERYDGKGYPDKLVGDDIPISAQIVSIADVYDALVSERVYKAPYTKDEAFEMIMNGKCGVFNPILLECFKEAREDFENLADSLK